MYYFFYSCFTIITIFLLIILVYKTRYRLSSIFVYPLVYHFIINFIGVSITLFTDNRLTSVGINITQSILIQVSLEFIISYALLLTIFYLFHRIYLQNFDETPLHVYFATRRAARNNNRLTVSVLIVLAIDVLIYGIPPGLMLITDGIDAALQQKGEIIISKMENGVPILGYFVRYMPIFALVHVSIHSLFQRKFTLNFLLLLLVFMLYSMLSLVKSYFLLPFGLIIFIYLQYWSTVKLRAKIIVSFFLALSVIPFFLLSSDSGFILDFLHRLLLVQHEGMYVIRDLIEQPSTSYLFYSSPLRHILDLNTVDPAAEVVEHYFGRGTGWVNMNSFYSGQGFAMFGIYYIAVVPSCYLISLYLSMRFSAAIIGKNLAFICVGCVYMFLPLSNNIANLIWLKDVIAVVIISCCLRLLLIYQKRWEVKNSISEKS